MIIKSGRNTFRKALGWLFLVLGIFGLSNFIIGVLLLVFGKEYFSKQGTILLPVFLVLSIVVLMLSDKLLHIKKGRNKAE